MKTPLLILGASGFGKEVFSWLPTHYQVEAFYSGSATRGDSLFGVPVLNSLDGMGGIQFIAAVGDTWTREKLSMFALSVGLVACEPIVHPTCVIGRSVILGRNSILCPQSVVTTGVRIGDGFLLNLSATIGHDCTIGEYVTVSPGANISGNVTIGRRAYIGTNSCIREKLNLEERCTVGMGAVVTKDVCGGSTVIGNPARPFTKG